MRRRDREITDAREIARIMELCQVASIALSGETPYVVPVNFGFAMEDGAFCLYIHGAREGEKLRRMALDPRAAGRRFMSSGRKPAWREKLWPVFTSSPRRLATCPI